jgi:hypothetical protein
MFRSLLCSSQASYFGNEAAFMRWLNWLTKWTDRWRNWTGDHEMELAIRRHLSDRGYRGAAAELRAVKLIAIQRPGWVQIYRFEAVAIKQISDYDAETTTPQPRSSILLYGLVRDDGRTQSEVETFVHPGRRIERFHQWAEGMITLRGAFAKN